MSNFGNPLSTRALNTINIEVKVIPKALVPVMVLQKKIIRPIIIAHSQDIKRVNHIALSGEKNAVTIGETIINGDPKYNAALELAVVVNVFPHSMLISPPAKTELIRVAAIKKI